MMENAGREICYQVLNKIKKNKFKKVLVIAGCGNNGGGVIAASRHLSAHGMSLKLVILGTKNSLSIPNKLNLSLIRANPKIQIICGSKNLKKVLIEIQNSELIIDGIFGIGANHDIAEPYYSIISAINDSKAYVISNDVPSGINADTGQIFNIAVKPNYLVVLHKPKRWMSKIKIPKFIVVDIGIPIEISS